MLFILVGPAASISLALPVSAGLVSTSAKSSMTIGKFSTRSGPKIPNRINFGCPDLHVLRVQVLIVIVFDGDPSLRHGVLMRSDFQIIAAKPSHLWMFRGVIFSHSDGNFSHSRIQLRLSASPAIVRVALERCRWSSNVFPILAKFLTFQK
ncbi:hypothetical protein CY34DRAFT_446316 [Suillus luteus UH-Slu-Lm8-n1]|uniref:Secreted protein n=1 Tax=Suillus luteus UH-Slu-Lm8-n1 TaxID=930992 RepID=A0A0D0A7R4_9AGAM|nr:hypothetical protein CY34DRAFT_446316 [Suillus luteus UH-Slu-Lm8-n1]